MLFFEWRALHHSSKYFIRIISVFAMSCFWTWRIFWGWGGDLEPRADSDGRWNTIHLDPFHDWFQDRDNHQDLDVWKFFLVFFNSNFLGENLGCWENPELTRMANVFHLPLIRSTTDHMTQTIHGVFMLEFFLNFFFNPNFLERIWGAGGTRSRLGRRVEHNRPWSVPVIHSTDVVRSSLLARKWLHTTWDSVVVDSLL